MDHVHASPIARSQCGECRAERMKLVLAENAALRKVVEAARARCGKCGLEKCEVREALAELDAMEGKK